MALTQVKTLGIADDAVTQDKVANDAIDITEIKAGVDGKIISYDASGNPVAVGPGTDGQVLTSTGAGSPPAFEDAAGGGVDGISSSADANAITIDSSEHVIVGGTTVSNVHTNNQDFVVGNSSNANTGMALNCASGGYCSIVMSDSTGDKNKGLIAYNHADDSFKICNDPATGSDGLVLQSDHDVKISSGDLLFGTAGKGVVLGATSNTDANTLDDYEEGTWTPAYSTASGSVGTYSSQIGRYTKIGNIVYCFFRIQAADGDADGATTITGLPFTAHNSQNQYVGQPYIYMPDALTGQSHAKDLLAAGIEVGSNSTTMAIYVSAAVNEDLFPSALDFGVCSNTYYIRISHNFFYTAA